jgi:ketosteroid isomerase-like protein
MMRTYFATNTTNPVRVIGEPGVTLIDRNAAVVYVTHTTEGRADRAAHEGVWTGVLRREPGGWKIVHSHSSDRRNQRGERIQD